MIAPSLCDRLIAPPRAAYLHIPFCRRRCYYCDFPITVVGDKPPLRQGTDARINGSNSGTIAHYVEILAREIRQTPSLGASLETVFFGGGTPSLLSVDQVERLLTVLDQQFGIAAAAEISMEIDPDTFGRSQLQGYQSAGVNRFSLGVQAFQPELLQRCGRSHTVADIETAVDWIHQLGITNFSLDLISGLPQQTLAEWQDSLERAIALQPAHLSCYDLTIEPGTPFSRQYQPGLAPLPTDETTAAMYRMASHRLQAAGYEHYEISNYARPGFQCRHNRVYWENRPFYGFGMGATSYVRGVGLPARSAYRLARPRKTREYYAWVEAQDNDFAASSNPPDATDLLLDTLMLGLRLAEGIRLSDLRQQFGDRALQQIWAVLYPYYRQGWVNVHPTPSRHNSPLEVDYPFPETGSLCFTDPEGFLFSNVMLVKLFEQVHLSD